MARKASNRGLITALAAIRSDATAVVINYIFTCFYDQQLQNAYLQQSIQQKQSMTRDRHYYGRS